LALIICKYILTIGQFIHLVLGLGSPIYRVRESSTKTLDHRKYSQIVVWVHLNTSDAEVQDRTRRLMYKHRGYITVWVPAGLFGPLVPQTFPKPMPKP
jgi:hypothetical protein